jgi:fermentation-respiration switch protein FrsA (DUF1100 family)
MTDTTSALPPAKYLASLCHQVWPSEEVLPQITNIPILFLSGLQDEIVPYVSSASSLGLLLTPSFRPSHMAKLFQVCRSEPKIWKELPNGSHNDTVAEPGYFAYIEDFLSDHVAK